MEKQTLLDFLLEQLNMLKEMIDKNSFYYMLKKVELDKSQTTEKMIPLTLLPMLRATINNNENKEKELMSDFVFGYIAKAKTLNFNEEAFNELYEELTFYIKHNKYIFRTIGYISGCIISQDIECYPIKLIQPRKEYLEFFYNYDSRTTGAIFEPLSTNFTLINANAFLLYEQTVEDPDKLVSIRKHVENIMKSIILVHGTKEYYSLSSFYTFSYLYEGALIKSVDYFFEFPKRPVFHSFNLKYLDNIKQIYSKIEQLPYELLALNRIYSSLTRLTIEDRFLDLMIALESLFPNINHEATYRLSLYTASLLKHNINIYKQVENLYRKRGNFVHGTKAKVKPQDYESLDYIVRSAILICIDLLLKAEKKNKVEDMLKDIEREILSSLLPNNTEYQNDLIDS